MRQFFGHALAILLIGVLASPAMAMVIRDDRPDSLYRDLGNKFPAVGAVVPEGEATLIAPQWAITAAHVTKAQRSKDSRPTAIVFEGSEYTIENVFPHPGWTGESPENDIALIKLSKPVTGITPVEIYSGADELGMAVTFVGRGDFGTGVTGPTRSDKVKRGATNSVFRVWPRELVFRFDAPGDSNVTELEGISGPGDSGGPALIEKDGRLYIIGVSVAQKPPPSGKGRYGAREFYSRVSAYSDWIRETIGGRSQNSTRYRSGGNDLSYPDTPAGKHLKEFVEAINSGEREMWSKFINEHYRPGGRPLEDRLQGYGEIHANYGGFDLHSIRPNHSPLSVTGHYKVRNPASPEEWLELTPICDSAPPHLLLGVRLESSLPPLELPDRALTEAELNQKLKEVLDQRAKEDRFSGAVLVARGDKIIAQGAWGEASQRYHVPNNIETKFNLGSMNKMFTALAIGQLVEQGKLRFDTKLGEVLPDYPDKDARDKVTISHLLTHTSGMGDFFSEEFDRHGPSLHTLSDFLPFITDKPLAFEPGAEMSYSNGGFIVLGLIIEIVSGQNYFDYIREHIYKPAGMANSDHYDTEIPVENLAIGYTRMSHQGPMEGPRRENYYRHPPRGGGSAGGGYSTVIDLHRYARALASDKLVSRGIRDSLWTPHAQMGPEMGYGYGFGVERMERGFLSVGHNGGAPGISASFHHFPELDLTVAALANYDMVAEGAAQLAIRLALHGLTPPAPIN